jgi:hypothetical protein
MRFLITFAALGIGFAAADVHARLFRQTYGAVTPTEEGGCQWNANQDYFVPRHCDSCRYGLFSACKKGHTISPACRHLHPLYAGYCSPYGACRYRWRDHVYKTFCGCTPLRCTYGPWRNEQCKECFLLHHNHKPCNACGTYVGCRQTGSGCSHCDWAGGSNAIYCSGPTYYNDSLDYGELPHVEPLGGEILGSIAALPNGSLGSGGSASPALGAIPVGAAAGTSGILPALGIPTAPAGALNYP